MAEETLASAVAVPEQEPLVVSPDPGLKRRNSSIADIDTDTKRRRLSAQDEQGDSTTSHRPTSPDPAEQRPARRESRQVKGRDEERKRGQRLFGALLGTLSQTPSAAAQRRRADIERKQQDKLKLQEEEYGELKKKKREEREAIRRKEQRYYEEESMRTCHSNLLAMAHFLKTKSEPVLYYKPWELRPEEEDVIRKQIEETEASISRERAEFEARYPPEEEDEPKKEYEEAQRESESQDQAPLPDTDVTEQPKDTTQESSNEADVEVNHSQGMEAAPLDTTPAIDANVSVSHPDSDVHRAADDDGGEVVEDNEDTVIY